MGGPRQALLVKVASVVTNWALPLDDRLMLVKLWSYKVNGKGKRDGGDRIIPVIADIRRAWHDSAAYLSYCILGGAGVAVAVGCRSWRRLLAMAPLGLRRRQYHAGRDSWECRLGSVAQALALLFHQ